MSGNHIDKWLPKGGLGRGAYAELRTGRANWREWTALLKSQIWTDGSCLALRSRLQNPSGEAPVKPSLSTTTTSDLVRVEMEFGH